MMTGQQKARIWKLLFFLPYPLIALAFWVATLGNLGSVWLIYLGMPWSMIISLVYWLISPDTMGSALSQILVLSTPFINTILWIRYCLKKLRLFKDSLEATL